MTSQPPPAGTAEPIGASGPPRLLRRRSTDRVIGGVAAGIADYLNIDPLLVRAGFVGLMIFGGAGLVLYVGAWLLIPAEGERYALVESLLRRVGLAPRRLIAALIFVAAGIVLINWVGRPIGYDLGSGYPISSGWDGQVILVALMVIIGLLLLRRGGGTASVHAAAPAASDLGASIPLDAERPPAAPIPEVAASQPEAPRSPLAWYAVAATLIGVGLLALVANVTQVRVLPGQFFGVALAILGMGLVVGSWWGRARRLIVPAIVILPFAIVAAFVTAPIEGGTGDLRYTPTTVSELRDAYRLAGGRLVLDLRDLQASAPVHLAASVAIGQLVVIVPTGSRLDVDAHVGAGESQVLGSIQSGTGLTDRYVRGSGSRQFVLELEAGIGEIVVGTED